MIKVFRGSTELTNFILSNPYKDTLDEELDRASFQIKTTTRLTNLSKYEKFTFQITQNNVLTLGKTLALFDYVETYEGEYWLYQLTLISPTKILENIIINGMAETYCPLNNQSLYQQLVRVASKINAQLSLEMSEMATPLNIAIDTDLNNNQSANYIGNVASNDFLWDGQNTLREIYQDMFDKADMLVICDGYSYENGKITYLHLTGVKREKRGTQLASGTSIEGGGLNAIKSVIKGITIHRDSEFNSGNIASLIKNGICNSEVKSAYLPARNTDLTIDEASTWHIETQEPIYSLNRVVAMMPISIDIVYWKNENDSWSETYWYAGGGHGLDQVLLPYDITEYIVEKDVFDVMPLSEQKKHLYFKRGEKGIYGLYQKYKSGLTGLFSETAMFNIADEIFPFYHIAGNDITYYVNSNEVVSWNNYDINKLLIVDNNSVIEWQPTNAGYDIHISASGEKENGAIKKFKMAEQPSESYLKYALFSVNYQPYADAVVKIEKQTMTNGNVKNLCVLKNQSDRTIDAEKYYKSQQALINRLGEEEMTIDCEFKMDTNAIWQLGDYITLDNKNWTLTEREFEINGKDFIKARMTFSKNYNARNSAINMNRDKRLYGIPLNQYVDRYIILKNIPYYISKLFVNSWDDFTNDTTTEGYTLLDLITINGNDRVARCKDNYAVDIERTKHSSTIVNVNLRYCDEDTGYKENITLKYLADYLFNQYTITDYSRLPFIPSFNPNDATTLNLWGIKKDKMERIVFICKE